VRSLLKWRLGDAPPFYVLLVRSFKQTCAESFGSEQKAKERETELNAQRCHAL